MKVRVNQKLVFVPNMLDQIDGRTNLKKGDLVKVINLPGCPKANTMGHCYVGHPITGEFIGMVSCNSLVTPKEWAEYQAKKAILLGLQLLGATNAPKATYENVKGGSQDLFDALMTSGHITRDDGFYVLTSTGREACK
jgi:hypothetical protein